LPKILDLADLLRRYLYFFVSNTGCLGKLGSDSFVLTGNIPYLHPWWLKLLHVRPVIYSADTCQFQDAYIGKILGRRALSRASREINVGWAKTVVQLDKVCLGDTVVADVVVASLSLAHTVATIWWAVQLGDLSSLLIYHATHIGLGSTFFANKSMHARS
jgi:hypothetical protein